MLGLEFTGGPRPRSSASTTLLPQTQCTRCGYPGCRPYAQAIAAGEADINRCPPGGEATIVALAALTGKPVREPLDPACGAHGPLAVARIDEAACIGCTLCIDACPVDAIIGAPKRMHAVLASQCTGCELCVAALPGRLHRARARPDAHGRRTTPLPRGAPPRAQRAASPAASGSRDRAHGRRSRDDAERDARRARVAERSRARARGAPARRA